MVDEGDTQLATANALRRDFSPHVLPAVPVPALSLERVQLEANGVLDLLILDADVVVETAPVEVIGGRAVIA